MDPATPPDALFGWLGEQAWNRSPDVEDIGQLRGVLKLLLHRQAKMHEWPLEDLQILLAVLRQATHTSPAPAPGLAPTPPHAARVELVSDCLEIILRWATACMGLPNPSPLRGQTVHAAAQLGSDAAAQVLGAQPPHDLHADSAAWAALLIKQALHLWVLVGRLRAIPMPQVVDRVAQLLDWPRAVTCLLQHGGPEAWRGVLKALLLDLTEEDAAGLSATEVEYQLTEVCLRVVSGSSNFWAWDAFAETLMLLPEDEEEVVDGVLWPADSIGWRREQATFAVLEAMDAPASWQERGVASVGAVALLSGRFDDDRLWKKLLQLLKDVMRRGVPTERGTPEAEGLRTARVGLCRALVLLGLSRFCARSFEGESRAWTREWGTCLAALLRLALEDVVVSGTSNDSARGKQRAQYQADVLAGTLCERCLGTGGEKQQDMAKALTALFKASDAGGQTEAFSILRAYARSLATAGKGDSWGLVLLLQVCLVLADPASAAIASTDQVIWVLEVLDALAGLVMARPASPSLLQGALLQASRNLQEVLEDDGEEAWLKEARDWVMKALGRQKERAAQRSITTTPKHQPQSQQEENRLAYLIHLAFSLCIQTRRPAPHQYVAEITRFLLQEVLHPYFPRGTVAPAQVHKCLRAMVSNPTLLAYRAGRKEHWDEARRRVTAVYVRVALESYPESTPFQDLAYCVGAAIGTTPTEDDPAGQALLLHCLQLIQDRTLALCRDDAELRQPATRELVKLLFQTLIVCPSTVLERALQSLGKDFVLRGFAGGARLTVLRLLKGVVFGEVETMRQSRLAKWYLELLAATEEEEEGEKEKAAGGRRSQL